MEYRSATTGNCVAGFGGLTMLTTLASGNDQVLSESGVFGDCYVFIPYQPDLYWVISSDSLGISDTLRLQNVVLDETTDGCCDCNPFIKSADIFVNDQQYSNSTILRTF